VLPAHEDGCFGTGELFGEEIISWRQMRVLVITPYYAPDLGPAAPLLTMLSEDLAASGHEVTVLASVPHFPTGQVSPPYRGRAWQWEMRNGVRVCRAWVPSGNRANLRHRLLTFLIYQVLVSLVGWRLKYDVALVINPAIETGLPFALLVWLRRKPSIYGVWDLYPEVGVQLGVFRHALVIALVKTLEDFCLRRATFVQALSDGFLPSLQKRIGLSNKLVVIPPWLDTDFIQPLPRHNAFSTEYGLDDHFTVMYAGNLGLSQGLEHVLMAAKLLSWHPHLRFVFIGDGAQREYLVSQAGQLSLANVKFIPYQPRERLPEVLASADISLVSLQPGIGDDSLPSKTFPILASGRPILAIVEQGSVIWNLVQRSQAGICVPPSKPKALANAILLLVPALARRQQMGQNGREYALRFHSRQAAAGEFEHLLRSICH